MLELELLLLLVLDDDAGGGESSAGSAFSVSTGCSCPLAAVFALSGAGLGLELLELLLESLSLWRSAAASSRPPTNRSMTVCFNSGGGSGGMTFVIFVPNGISVCFNFLVTVVSGSKHLLGVS